ncbi:MAG: XDD3 domain-containing surface protein [Jaaginema sp. PMC 1079.18]|nr:XDD3 domain-containing surface protein [Jaaginema sp. PMC 1080.18]MEC4851985.1 XDD3 domain-containing surface protein [Jaaginema sp. PMC 1079.18]MEC4868681.1 XDD3 domain-containing surface protein [Jaaginema sp. PMC 1078.18]
MKYTHFQLWALLLSSACIYSSDLISSSVSHAAVFHNNWSYAVDSFDDSIDVGVIGGTQYEIYGTAFQQNDEKVTFAINSNFNLAGANSIYANDNHIGWGDLLFKVGNETFGINFVTNNDSSAPTTGLYGNVTTKELAQENSISHANLGAYNTYVASKGKTPSLGDLPLNTTFFDPNQHVHNLIASGQYLGGVDVITDVSNLGLDFGNFGATGSQTLALSIDRELLPEDGEFTFWLSPECNNDLIAHTGKLEKVPEPSAALGLGGFSLLLYSLKNRRRKSSQLSA